MIVLLHQIMLITDINGKRIEGTNLAGAIKQATLFAGTGIQHKTFKKLELA